MAFHLAGRPCRSRLAAGLLLAALVGVGCGDSADGGSGSSGGSRADDAAIAAPERVVEAGELVACADMTFPPYIFTDDQNQPAGRDADVGAAIGELMGIDVRFQQTGFDGIVAAVQSKKCDIILGDIYATPEREKVLDFVPYAQASEALLVPAGNPENIVDLKDMAGHRLAGSVGSTTEQFLNKTSDELEADGAEPIDVAVFNGEPDAVSALKAGDVDGVWLGEASMDEYVEKDPEAFERWSPKQYNSQDVGIAVRKDDAELKTALEEAIDTLYSDRRMCKIFAKSGLESSAVGNKCR